MKRKKSSCCNKKNNIKNSVEECKPDCGLKKGYKKDKCDMNGCSDKYEVSCVDQCVKLAMQAEELFERAVICECSAKENYDEAQKLDEAAKVLSKKSENLYNKANNAQKDSKELEQKAQELLDKSQMLCEQAKCLYKEAKQAQDMAKCNCEKAKCLYEKAYDDNDKAKELYNSAMKCDEKALECYKKAGEKIKEYEEKSKKCENMIKKCDLKLDECNSKMCMEDKYCYKTCGEYEIEDEKEDMMGKYKQKDIKVYVDYLDVSQLEANYINLDNKATTYVNPMYDMSNMYYSGGFMDKYPTMESKYMEMDNTEDMNEAWMNYYMMMQQMMHNMMK